MQAEPATRSEFGNALRRRSLALGSGRLLLLFILRRRRSLRRQSTSQSGRTQQPTSANVVHLGLAQRLERLVRKVDPDPILLDVVLVSHWPEEVARHLDVAWISVERPVVRLSPALDCVQRKLADNVDVLWWKRMGRNHQPGRDNLLQRRQTHFVIVGVTVADRLDLGRESVEERDVVFGRNDVEEEVEVLDNQQ